MRLYYFALDHSRLPRAGQADDWWGRYRTDRFGFGDGDQKAGQDAKSTYPAPATAPADPASVSLKDGKLTISANNSDLIQILQELAHISGMKVIGSDNGPRVFGQYGPAEAHDVLSSLLAGSGYDFIMVGGATGGMPRTYNINQYFAPFSVPSSWWGITVNCQNGRELRASCEYHLPG